MTQYQVNNLYEITGECKKIWLDGKKKDVTEFDIFGLDFALPQIIRKFPTEVCKEEPIFADNAYWIDCKDNSRMEICLTLTGIVMVRQHFETGDKKVFRVEFGFPF